MQRRQRFVLPALDFSFRGLPTPRVDGPAVRSLGGNARGRDLVVGDVHGQVRTLEHLLDAVGYSPHEGDRLLLLGDVIDRGPDPAGMLGWLDREDVTCIRGNHEQLMLDALEGNAEIEDLWKLHNGGEWFSQVDSVQAETWLRVLRTMPLAVEVDGERGPFVLVHSEVPKGIPWQGLRELLEEGDRTARIRSLWARNRIQGRHLADSGVPDVWRTFHGHVPVRAPVVVANMRWIDTGAAYASVLEEAALTCVPLSREGGEEPSVRVGVNDVEPQFGSPGPWSHPGRERDA